MNIVIIKQCIPWSLGVIVKLTILCINLYLYFKSE